MMRHLIALLICVASCALNGCTPVPVHVNIHPNSEVTVPALREALNLPKKDRGKPPDWSYDELLLPLAAEEALESIGTPEALKAVEEFKKLGPKLIESSVPDGVSGVDADFINKNGITLRFSANTGGWCRMYADSHRALWDKSFKTTDVTIKPRRGDPKLVDGTDYTLKCLVTDDWDRYSKITITFTTKE